MIKAYRYTTDTVDWEIPAGGINNGESIIKAAQREVLEETGYTTTNHQLLNSYNVLNGISDKRHHIVLCNICEIIVDFDKNEIKAVKWMSLNRVLNLIKEGEIKDELSINGLLYYNTFCL